MIRIDQFVIDISEIREDIKKADHAQRQPDDNK